MRKAILSLARCSRWARDELRGMTPEEFAAYLETASELVEETNNGS